MTEQEYDELDKRLRKADNARCDIIQMRSILDGPGMDGTTRIKIPIKPFGGAHSASTDFTLTAGELWPLIRGIAEMRLEKAIKELAEL